MPRGAYVACHGKGRKDRITPLAAPPTVAIRSAWIRERGGNPDEPLLPTTTGRPLSRDVEHRIAAHVATATATCTSIATKP